MSAVATAPAPAPASAVDMTRTRSLGLMAGTGMITICAVGMALTFNGRNIVDPVLSMGWLTLGLMPFIAGWSAAGRVQLEGVESAPPGPVDVVNGALTGLWAGGAMAVFVAVLGTVGDSLRDVLIQLSPQLLDMLSFERGTGTGVMVALVMPVAVAVLASGIRVTAERLRKSALAALSSIVIAAVLEQPLTGVLDKMDERLGLDLSALEDILYSSDRGLTVVGAVIVAVVAFALRFALHGRRAERIAARPVGPPTTAMQVRLYGGLLAAAVVLPLFFDRSVTDILINVIIFAIMALGLNIVIGLTGMLDLGYVAFFAVGAYTTAVLTAPPSDLTYSPELSFWVALPVAVVVAMLAGLLIGTPVIRLRGDYLAIVTLGFAAIAQRLVVSDWFAPVLGGPQGVRDVPGVNVVVDTVNATTAPTGFLWLSLGFLGVAIYAAWRLQHSRLGRAWNAIREDETVAEAMGINTAAYKLMSFCVGAVFASLAGGLFAAKVSSSFPTSFELLVSVLVLVVVIVGGTGYVPGVLLGAVVLVGVLGGPTTQGLLAEFANYKLFVYSVVLVVMMLRRPEGLLPKPDKSRQIAQEEMDQDAWFDKNVGGSSAVAGGKPGDETEEVEA